MKFFHRTSAKNAASILKVGFRDSTGRYMMNTTVAGVWVSDKIVKEEGKPYREWCVPARLLNKGKIVRAGRDRPGEHP